MLAVEPNLEKHKDFELSPLEEAIESADLYALLVAHKEFKSLQINKNLDFCGVLNP